MSVDSRINRIKKVRDKKLSFFSRADLTQLYDHGLARLTEEGADLSEYREKEKVILEKILSTDPNDHEAISSFVQAQCMEDPVLSEALDLILAENLMKKSKDGIWVSKRLGAALKQKIDNIAQNGNKTNIY